MQDLGRFHNGWTHSLIAGLGVSVIVASLAWTKGRAAAEKWFFITLLCYGLHVMMDYLTVGRGVLALWPLSLERYAFPIKLFYGLHWSDGWLSVQHVWTVITELGFVVALGTIAYTGDRLMHSVQARKTHVPR
jgi:membrane-bound metal-dependent hydrolase YbcI (DUF457 family)